jgi:TetR/AcrR family transcriptional regulator, transcriptional repressor for nem operon
MLECGMATEQAVPPTRKGQATRERIIVAAAQEISGSGVGRTSLDEVKAAAGVSSSQLYHYFSDKHALVLAVIDHQTEMILGAQQPLLSQLDSIPALRSWADMLVAMQRERECQGGCPIGSIGAELAETDPQARAGAAQGLQRWEHAIRDGLRRMHARGDLAADPDGLALSLFVAVQGGFLLSQVHRDPSPLAVGLHTAIDHIESLTRSHFTADTELRCGQMAGPSAPSPTE